MKTGKLYKIERLVTFEQRSTDHEWVFVWDNPYGGNRVIDKLPVGKPYMFIRHEPGMSVWCNILYDDKMGWIHIQKQPISELTDNGG
jgi:hypothetical protein